MELDLDGAELATGRLTLGEMDTLATVSERLAGQPGLRLGSSPRAWSLISPGSTLLALARERIGPLARPVRRVLFDKTARNWGVAWRQDRTIVVAERIDAPGFGPWSRKGGEPHVEPPFEVLAGMLTLRAHLDDCDESNAPLAVALGSHRLGRVVARDAAAAAARCEQATCLARAGEVWLYRTPILHASRPARKPSRRRVLQVDFAAKDLPHGLTWAFA